MGDNMRHFMDVTLLSFSHYLKSILTLYLPPKMSNLALKCQKPAFTHFATAKLVGLEMGENMGHFVDVKLNINFSPYPHPQSPITKLCLILIKFIILLYFPL